MFFIIYPQIKEKVYTLLWFLHCCSLCIRKFENIFPPSADPWINLLKKDKLQLQYNIHYEIN